MARGRKTGGRQKGTPNKATLAKRARAQEGLRLAEERGVTRLDIILSYMRDEGRIGRVQSRSWHTDRHRPKWHSEVLPRYARRTRQVAALIAGVYLSGTNTRRVQRALGALCQREMLAVTK